MNNRNNSNIFKNNAIGNYLKSSNLHKIYNLNKQKDTSHSLQRKINFSHYNDYNKDILIEKNLINLYNKKKYLNLKKDKNEKLKQITFDNGMINEKNLSFNQYINNKAKQKNINYNIGNNIINYIRLNLFNENNKSTDEKRKNEKNVLKIKKQDIKYVNYKRFILEKMKKKIGNKMKLNLYSKKYISKEQKLNSTNIFSKENSKLEQDIINDIKTKYDIKSLKKDDLVIVKENEILNEEMTNKIDDSDSELSYFDIDKIQTKNQVPKDYLNVIYKNLLLEEEKDLVGKPNYNKITKQKVVNEQMRSILIDWIIDVHYKFGFKDETLFMTVFIIDRYLTVKQISKLYFQLLGITAMFIACKHEEINLPKVEDFIYITDNAYSKEEVFSMENEILNLLKFELLYPSPIKFYDMLSLIFNFEKKQYLFGKYLMESFLNNLKWINFKPSIISCACAYIVMKYYKMKNYQESYNIKYYNANYKNKENIYNESSVKECAKEICSFVDNINKTNFLSCKKKYSDLEHENIALIIEGTQERIKQ